MWLEPPCVGNRSPDLTASLGTAFPERIGGRLLKVQARYPSVVVTQGDRGYPTPEEAALAGLDPRYARVVVTRYESDDLAEVELATNTPEAPYPYFVQATRMNGLWFEGPSSNAPSYPEAEPR